MSPTRHDPDQPQLPLDEASVQLPAPADTRAPAHAPANAGAVQRELEALRIDNARLRRLLSLGTAEARAAAPSQAELALRPSGPVTASSPEAEKIRLYMELFRARTDVFALRWENAAEGKAGWVPAVPGGWRKWMDRENTNYTRLTPAEVEGHLRGTQHIGLYPLTARDTCCFVAADFDGDAAMLDALAYLKAARYRGIPAALEVSQSGRGAHVWIFFAQEVPAESARSLASSLLHEAMGIRGSMSLRSYDRLFPSQDRHTGKGMGNLIAAPLSGRRRKHGTTLFLDTSTLEPYEDQWAYLSGLGRVSPGELKSLLRLLPAPVTGRKTRLEVPASSKISPRPAPIVNASIAARITLRATDLGPAMVTALKHAAALPNPDFYERQRQRRSTWGIPRFLTSYDETLTGDLILPRGLLPRLEELVQTAGSKLRLTDNRVVGEAADFAFTATLHPEQQRAFNALAARTHAVLVAAPGSGKTVMACALIAAKSVSTLVLVDRKALADQWRGEILTFLGEKSGQIGGGKSKTTGRIDVALLPTLARRKNVAELTAGYGFVVVDECHHVPAAAFSQVMNQVPARSWLGLTATPYRRDGLEELIFHQLGTFTHEFATARHGELPQSAAEFPAPALQLRLHDTAFDYDGDIDPSEPGGITRIYKILIEDRNRLAQVAGDVIEAHGQGRQILVLSTWKRHLQLIAEELRGAGLDPIELTGSLKTSERRAAMERINSTPEDEALLVLGTGSLIGEGFDCPRLDTLFLAAPVSFKGRLVQYAGRVTRPHPGKATAVVHDYVDVLTPVIARAYDKRAGGYRDLGFSPAPGSDTGVQ
ncbi:TOTE conflict system archaeo-eukaryotic primase domain-containing protein [Paeniglutamicibacter sp. ORCA_105]|uniref:TOTE conflict system archaeo-eukaryotic primase domain-containing protein n=1 Tax=Paeniglutamicibacter sp. ORCA_105 TaxID=3377336 RepID=UPI003895F49D